MDPVRGTSGTVGHPLPETAADGVFVVAVVVGALVLTRFSTFVLRVLIGRVARRAMVGSPSRWRARLPRPAGETVDLAELRRRHRIDATAAALSRLVAIAVWVAAVVVVLHHFEIDITLAVSGAGFVGLIVAFGAQNSMHDYISGLHILMEDRYGEGDEVEVKTAAGQHVRGRVTALGAFATRIEAGDTTWHVANRMMTEVANHSQRGVASTVDVEIGPALTLSREGVVAAAQAAAGDLPTQSVMIVQAVEPVEAVAVGAETAGGDTGAAAADHDGGHDADGTVWRVTVRGTRALRAEEKDALAERLSERLGSS
jgi:small conductance mechanosensitive channel